MGVWTTRLQSLLHEPVFGGESWRLLAAALIVLGGWALAEWGWRRLDRRWLRVLDQRGLPADTFRISWFFPGLRLALLPVLIRLSEIPLILEPEVIRLVHGFEILVLALAILLLSFQAIGLLGRMREKLPAAMREAISPRILANVQAGLRLAILAVVAAGVVYLQRDLIPAWVRAHNWWRYLLLLAVLWLLYVAGRGFARILASVDAGLQAVEGKERLRLLLRPCRWPVWLVLAALWVYAAKDLLAFGPPWVRLAEAGINVLATLAVVLFLYRLLDVVEYELGKFAAREDTGLDQNFVQMVRLFARVLVIGIGSIYLIRAISGKPMSTLLAGLGIGGLAVALAAQDTLKNFFGSIMIMLDKPFSVGQRVVVDSTDGVVEEIGFRSTRVRTLTGHLVTIPNEKMATATIENIGRRPSIRRLTNITITYDTPPDKVERAVNIIREILADHEGMHPDYPPRVYFNEFNDSSLNIMMIYWYHPPDYWSYVAFSERVNLEIMRAFEKEGIEFAFPTTTTYLAHDPRRPLRLRVDGGKEPTI